MSAILNQLWAWVDTPAIQMPSMDSQSEKGPTLTQAVRRAFEIPDVSPAKIGRGVARGVEPRPTLTEMVKQILPEVVDVE